MPTIKTKKPDEPFNAFRRQLAQNKDLLHSVKNSLQNISGLLSILAAKCEQQGIKMQTMEPICLELKATVTRLTEYLQQTPTAINLSRCSLNQLIEELIPSVQAQLMSRSINLQTRLAANLPLIYLDRSSIQKVLVNCLNNSQTAILAKTQPGGQIIITTKLLTSNNTVQILLEDNGIGLTPEQQANFFMPYYTTKNTGAGIGTTICQAIIKLHGGTISADGQLGSGCCVKIELPVQGGKTFTGDDLYSEFANMLL